jgi:hypothetical protein
MRRHRDDTIIIVRTTINIPDDIYQIARAFAGSHGISMGEAIAELARRGLRATRPVNGQKPFPCFELAANSKPITLEQTLNAEDEL